MALIFYDSWRTVSSTSSNSYKEDFQAFIDEEFEESPTIKTVKHNGVDIIVRVVGKFNTETVSRNNDNYQKIIFKQSDYVVNIGDIFEHDGDKWLCTDISSTPVSKSCSVTKCTNILNFYDQNHILYQINCIILDKQNINISEDKYLSTIDCDILVLIANTETNMLISSNDIFKIGIWNYYVTKPDDITKQGLIIVPMKFSEQEQTIPNYSLTILNGDLINLQQGNTIQLNIEVKDGTNIITPPPPYLFISSDENILTVNSNGLVMGISVGTTTVICKLQSDETIYDTISITVEEVPIADNFSVSISGLTTVKLNSNITLTANVLNNGVVDITKSVIWSLTNQDGSSNQYVSIVSQDGSSIVLKATSNSSYINKYVVVRASKSDDVNVYDEHILQIKNIF